MPSNHFDDSGHARMVDVSGKSVTRRIAVASADIAMNAEAAATVRQGGGRKGDVLAVARLAAIGASKWTPHLIPLCHAIPIEAVEVDFQWNDNPQNGESLRCRVTCQTTAKTGIEMEAMTAASIAALTVYDMLKSVDRGLVIGPVQLEHKTGGASGHWQRG